MRTLHQIGIKKVPNLFKIWDDQSKYDPEKYFGEWSKTYLVGIKDLEHKFTYFSNELKNITINIGHDLGAATAPPVYNYDEEV